MTAAFTILASAIIATLVVPLLRIIRGPHPADCVLAVLFTGTTGVGALLLLSVGLGDSRAIDVALVLALLSAVVGATFVRVGWISSFGKGGSDD